MTRFRRCAGCGEPMVIVDEHDTHPGCDPDFAAGVILDGAGQARASDPPSSKKAARQFTVRKGFHRGDLLLAFAASPAGLTDEEACAKAGLPLSSEYATRCSELKRMGLIADTHNTRPGASGVDRVIRRITYDGSRAARDMAQ